MQYQYNDTFCEHICNSQNMKCEMSASALYMKWAVLFRSNIFKLYLCNYIRKCYAAIWEEIVNVTLKTLNHLIHINILIRFRVLKRATIHSEWIAMPKFEFERFQLNKNVCSHVCNVSVCVCKVKSVFYIVFFFSSSLQ